MNVGLYFEMPYRDRSLQADTAPEHGKQPNQFPGKLLLPGRCATIDCVVGACDVGGTVGINEGGQFHQLLREAKQQILLTDKVVAETGILKLKNSNEG